MDIQNKGGDKKSIHTATIVVRLAECVTNYSIFISIVSCYMANTANTSIPCYRYTLFYQNEQTGIPPMRPMFYEFPGESNLFAIETQYMVSYVNELHRKVIGIYQMIISNIAFYDILDIIYLKVGDSLLVSPVTESGATSAAVTLPKGALWYNYFNGKSMESGAQHTGI